MQLNAFTISLMAATLINGVLLYFTWKHRPANASFELFLLILAITWWSFFAIFEAMAKTVFYKVLFSVFTYAAIPVVSVLFLLFACRFVYKDRWIIKRYLYPLFIIPLASLIMACTNNIHRLLWPKVTLGQSYLVGIYGIYEHGPWFWVNAIYSYLMLVTAIIILLVNMLRTRQLYNLQSRILIFSSIIPFIANLVYALLPGNLLSADITPVFFTFSGILLFFAIFYFKIFNLSPVAWETIIENLDQGVVLFNTQKQVVDVNNIFSSTLGIEKVKIGTDKSVLFDKYPEIDLFCDLKAGKKTKEIKINNDGQKKYLELSYTDLYDKNNKRKVGRMLLVRDITGKKLAQDKISQAMAEIRKSEEKFSKAFHSGSSLMAISRFEDDVFVDVNESFLKTLGFERDEVIGKTSAELNIIIDQEQRTEIKRAFKEKEKVSNLEVLVRGRDGSIHAGIFTIDLINIGDDLCWLTTMTDITDRKKIEEALQRSEERHRLLVENSHDIIYTINPEGVFTFASPSWTILLGHPVSEVTGKQFQLFVHPDDIPECVVFLKKVLETAKSQTGIEYRVQHLDGSWRWHTSNALPLFDDTGKVIGFEGSASDITARKQTESEILYLSYHDKLTGLYNRRFYEEELKRLDTKRNLPITLVIADVNGLKMANDAFGHLTGDRLLVKVASAIKKESRTDDIVARVGGDEFILLLPKTPISDAKKIISRINKKTAGYKLDNLIVSASFGCASKLNETEEMAEIFKKAEDNMYSQKFQESAQVRNRIINVIIEALYEKSESERRHSEMVSQLCEDLGRAWGLAESEVKDLKSAGLIHDIGKVSVDEKILNKPGKLSTIEWDAIKRHSETGYRILSAANDYIQIAKYVLSQHERWDGKGYPEELKGPEIPVQSRIIAIADAYASMVGCSPYREKMSEDAAIKEVKANSGTQFDPGISKIFVEKLLGKTW